MAKFLSFAQCVSAINVMGDKRTIFIEGENGIGKTAIFHALKKLPKYKDHIMVDPIDCTQMSDGSVWMPDIDKELGVSRELPNERFGVHAKNQKGVNGSKPIVVFLDEFGKAPQYIKNVLAPVVYEHRVGSYHMPEGSVVFCATNLGVENLGDTLPAHIKNRIIRLKMRKPTASEWITWSIDRGLNENVIAFVNNYPQVMDSFLDYEKGGKHSGKKIESDNGYIYNPRSTQDAYASPRSLHTASDVVSQCAAHGADDDVLEALLAGAVGDVTAEAIGSFIRFGKDICSYERVIADPDKAPLSTNPTAQLVQVFQFVTRCQDRVEAEAITKYVWRMRAELQSIFCNTVANSQRVAVFVTIAEFGKMLAAHKIFFSTK